VADDQINVSQITVDEIKVDEISEVAQRAHKSSVVKIIKWLVISILIQSIILIAFGAFAIYRTQQITRQNAVLIEEARAENARREEASRRVTAQTVEDGVLAAIESHKLLEDLTVVVDRLEIAIQNNSDLISALPLNFREDLCDFYESFDDSIIPKRVECPRS
jgi:hypothetical protein